MLSRRIGLFSFQRIRVTVAELVAQDRGSVLLNAEYLETLKGARDKNERALLRVGSAQIFWMGLLLLYAQQYKEDVVLLGINVSKTMGYGELLLIVSSLNFGILCYLIADYAIRGSAILGYIEGNLRRANGLTPTRLLVHAMPYQVMGDLVYSDRSDEFLLMPSSSRFRLFLTIGRRLVYGALMLTLATLFIFHVYCIFYVFRNPTVSFPLAIGTSIVATLFDLAGLFVWTFHSIRVPFTINVQPVAAQGPRPTSVAQ